MTNKSIAAIFAETAEPRLATPGLNRATIFFLIVTVVGLSCGVLAFIFGHHVIYHNTREMPWGMLISTYAFWAITSTGLCIYAAMSHVFGGTRMGIVSNRMVWMSIICIMAAFATIGVEIASPHRMLIYNILSPNTTSNIAGAQWWPSSVFHRNEATPHFLEQYYSAARFAFRRYQTLVGDAYGVSWERNFTVGDEPITAIGLLSGAG